MSAKSYSGLEKTANVVALLVLHCLLITLPIACSGGRDAEPAQKPAVPVAAAVAIQKSVAVELYAIGNVEAYSTVSVKSQANGELIQVHFTEGQGVKKGDPLFTIDPRPYEAAIKQAEANMAKDTAQLENARREAHRFEELSQQGLVAQEQYDRVRTTAAALESAVQADKALVENAHLQLKYCHIHAPISGVAGSLIVDQGNLIKANADTPMVVINQIQPIYVSFSVPETHLSEIKKRMSSGQIGVDAAATKGEAHPAEGVLVFVDNTVDNSTGTIRLKATFDNKENQLWPGQFVNVAMTLAVQEDALVIPSRAVQAAEQGQYVFVINKDLTVDSRPISVARTVGSEAIVEKGLQPGEQIVTDGQLRLVSGAKVEVKPAAENGK
ncbi:efflux RND transporter periplasmic adaptor subunit [Candidatus Poribacteria bacterium]|nr:efflux RND transporter periplasmic adaptor subunit [Candidatus Poribacteria bacterium]